MFKKRAWSVQVLAFAAMISSATFAGSKCEQFYVGFGTPTEGEAVAVAPGQLSTNPYHTFDVAHRSETLGNRPVTHSIHDVFQRLMDQGKGYSDRALAGLASHPSFQFVEIPLSGMPVTLGSGSAQRPVTLDKPIRMMATAVTQRMFAEIMESNPSEFRRNVQTITVHGQRVEIDGDERPVDSVTWAEAVEFARRLSLRTGRTFRLPTEAEWEVAVRAGTTTEYSHGDDVSVLGQFAHFDGNSGTHPVAQLRPNANGLYDMHGNVWEWTADAYSTNPASGLNPLNEGNPGSGRVIRGGGWNNDARRLRSAYRGSNSPGDRYGSVGFRLVEELP